MRTTCKRCCPVRLVFHFLVSGLLCLLSGCASAPRNAAHPGGREFLLRVAGELQRRGIEVQNIQEGAAADRSFLEFVASNATLTVGVTAADAKKTVDERRRDFQELIDTISGLAAHGLEVREFLYYSSQPHVVEFCNGKLFMWPPQKKEASQPAQTSSTATTTESGGKSQDKNKK